MCVQEECLWFPQKPRANAPLGVCSTHRLEEEQPQVPACLRTVAILTAGPTKHQRGSPLLVCRLWGVLLGCSPLCLVLRCPPCRFYCWLSGWLAGRSTPKVFSSNLLLFSPLVLSQGLVCGVARGPGASRMRLAGWLASKLVVGRTAGGAGLSW